jgi:hypothetical protein
LGQGCRFWHLWVLIRTRSGADRPGIPEGEQRERHPWTA